MKPLSLMLIASVITTAPGIVMAATVPRDIKTEISARIKSELLDPDSARISFFSYRRVKHGWVVCGTVNAKNTFGGYAGPQPFSFIANTDEGSLAGGIDRIDGDPALGPEIHNLICIPH